VNSLNPQQRRAGSLGFAFSRSMRGAAPLVQDRLEFTVTDPNLSTLPAADVQRELDRAAQREAAFNNYSRDFTNGLNCPCRWCSLKRDNIARKDRT